MHTRPKRGTGRDKDTRNVCMHSGRFAVSVATDKSSKKTAACDMRGAMKQQTTKNKAETRDPYTDKDHYVRTKNGSDAED